MAENKIVVSGSLMPSAKNVPLDDRTRVATFDDLFKIELPFKGMVVFVEDEEKFYVVKKLKAKTIGPANIEDSLVDEVEELIGNFATEEFVSAEIAKAQLGGGEGGGGTDSEEIAALQAELAKAKQDILDMTYGVEYEWIYESTVDGGSGVVDLGRDKAPLYWADWDAIMELEGVDDELFEQSIMDMYEKDIYRMYILRNATDHKAFNRYELVPMIDHAVQPENTYLAQWTPVKSIKTWNVDDSSFSFSAIPTSTMVIALMKVKEEYRGKFNK